MPLPSGRRSVIDENTIQTGCASAFGIIEVVEREPMKLFGGRFGCQRTVQPPGALEVELGIHHHRRDDGGDVTQKIACAGAGKRIAPGFGDP